MSSVAASGAATAPVAGQTVPPVPSPDSSIANAEKPFPLAAIVCVSIVGGIIAVIVFNKVYKWAYARRQHLQSNHNESPSPNPSNPFMSNYQHHRGNGGSSDPYMTQPAYMNYHPSVYARMSSHNSASTLGGLGGNKSDYTLPLPSSSTKTLANLAPSYKTNDSLSTFNQQLKTESFGSVMDQSGLVSTREGSANGSSGESSPWPISPVAGGRQSGNTSRSNTPPGGPISPPSVYSAHPGTLQRPGVRGDSSMSTDRLRAQGSRSSLLYPIQPQSQDRLSLAHAHSSSSLTGASRASQGSPALSQHHQYPQPRQPRLSGPPHARHSRVEIVPPAPLAPPPGTVVATDKATLAFSSLSGIGTGKALFGSNMHLASAASNNQLASTSSSASAPQDQQQYRQHRRQATGQTTQTSSSNGSGDDLSSFGAASGSAGSGNPSSSTAWFSTPAGTSDDNLMSKTHNNSSSSGSGGTLATSSEEAEETGSATAEIPVRRVMSPVRNTPTPTRDPQSPLDKLQANLQQSVSRNSQSMSFPATS